MASTPDLSVSSPMRALVTSIKEEPGTNSSPSGKAEKDLHQQPDPKGSAHGRESEAETNKHSVVTDLYDAFPAGKPKAVKVADHGDTDRSGNSAKGNPVSASDSAERLAEQETQVSLSKTSSLIRQASFLGEERDLGLEETDSDTDTECESAAEATTANSLEGDVDDSVTYRVMDNSTIVKLDPPGKPNRPASPATAVDCLDGHTITLVEDEYNVGTFKIAEIGEDNTLRVIDNERIVVFQDGVTMNELCKTNVDLEKSDTRNEIQLPSIHIDAGVSVPKERPSNKVVTPNDKPLRRVQDGGSELRNNGASCATEYKPADGGSRDTKAYSESKISQSHEEKVGSRTIKGQDPQAETVNAPGQTNPPSQSWHQPTENESSASPLARYKNSQSQFPNQAGPSMPGQVSSSSSTSSTQHQVRVDNALSKSLPGSSTSCVQYSHASAQPADVYQGFSGHPSVTAWPATGHTSPNNSQGEMAMPQPSMHKAAHPQNTPCTADSGHGLAGGFAASTSVHGPPASVGRAPQHPSHNSYMGAGSAPSSCEGYSVDAGRPWRPGKMNEGGHANMPGNNPHGANRESMAMFPSHPPSHNPHPVQHAHRHPSSMHAPFHQTPQQQHQQQPHAIPPNLTAPRQLRPIPPIHAPPVVRPYPMYPPGWDGSTHPPHPHAIHPSPAPPPAHHHPPQLLQHKQPPHLRYIAPAAPQNERSSARIYQKNQRLVTAPYMGQGGPPPLFKVTNPGHRQPQAPAQGMTVGSSGRAPKRPAAHMDPPPIAAAAVPAPIKGGFQVMASIPTSASSAATNNDAATRSNSNATTTTNNNSTNNGIKGEPARKKARGNDGQQTTVSISNLGTVASNVHTLKPCHIIAWYIDYLIHENEDRTQISRAFTLPVNLFHTDDFYFLDSLRKKIRFPSAKFLSWMQYHLPSLNASAIDFREGRPGGGDASGGLQIPGPGSHWSQHDWGWQNKTKRDIIHDVFFHFQHRKALHADSQQCRGGSGARPKTLV